MVPLLTLVSCFLLARLLLRSKPNSNQQAARYALGALWFITGQAHFTQTAALTAMLPPTVPYRTALIYLSGLLELAFAWASIWRPHARLGWAMTAFLVVALPANVYSALAGSGMGGQQGPAYLWFRVPLQLLFIAWSLWANGTFARSSPPTRNPQREPAP